MNASSDVRCHVRRLGGAAGLVAIAIAACTTGPPSPETPVPTAQASTVSAEPSGPATPTPSPASDSSAPADDEPARSIRITVDSQTVTASLDDNPTAQDLADRLPMTSAFSDFNNSEKHAQTPQTLTTVGVPAGADPRISDIRYYAPVSTLVFYYGDVGCFDSIVRIGQFRGDDIDLLQRQQGTFDVTIEAA